MPHFLINSGQIEDNKIIVENGELFNHLTRSLRIRPGEKVLFLDENEIRYETVTLEISSQSAVFSVNSKYKSNRKLNFNISLGLSVLKQDAQISAIQKATELGVKEIIPLYTDNCAVKKDIIAGKIDKWQKIAVESVKQCERADIPKVCELSTLNEIVGKFDNIFVFVERNSTLFFSDYLKQNKSLKGSFLVIIGCEGGFSEKEFEFFKKNNLTMLTLGNLILRADTACACGLNTVISGLREYGIY